MTKEIWKEVPNYENYMVSSRGNVKSMSYNGAGRERVMKQSLMKNGYLFLNLCKESKVKMFYTHQLVAMAFLGHVRCGHRLEVNHIDENKRNNNLSNLELLTQEQHKAKSVNKTSSYLGVSWNKPAKRWISQIRINGKVTYIGCFTNELEAHEAYQKKLKEIQK